jgi:hypothetical protein
MIVIGGPYGTTGLGPLAPAMLKILAQSEPGFEAGRAVSRRTLSPEPRPRSAADDLVEIVSFIAGNLPASVRRILIRLRSRAESLERSSQTKRHWPSAPAKLPSPIATHVVRT